MEEKFVPYDKMSKKKKREQDKKKRNTWGDFNPETKILDKNFKKRKQQEYEDSMEDY